MIDKNILTIEEAGKISKDLQGEGKRIVLVGGCFDILHIGHIQFLEKARLQADYLFVLLESDEKIKQLKGHSRPINTQIDRASLLIALKMVDFVVLLPPIWTNEEYDAIIEEIKPAFIATTEGDPNRTHKERQAITIGAQVVDVIKPVLNKSTSKITALLSEEL